MDVDAEVNTGGGVSVKKGHDATTGGTALCNGDAERTNGVAHDEDDSLPGTPTCQVCVLPWKGTVEPWCGWSKSSDPRLVGTANFLITRANPIFVRTAHPRLRLKLQGVGGSGF